MREAQSIDIGHTFLQPLVVSLCEGKSMFYAKVKLVIGNGLPIARKGLAESLTVNSGIEICGGMKILLIGRLAPLIRVDEVTSNFTSKVGLSTAV